MGGAVMGRRIFFLILMSVLLFSVLPVFADREPIWPTVNKQNDKTDESAGYALSAPAAVTGATSISTTTSAATSTGTTSTASSTASSAEEPIWTNFNNDPVKSHPDKYQVLDLDISSEPVLIQRIRTHHWNNGNGAQPGTISVYEDSVKIGTWPAVGRSAYGVPNVYWEALVDFIAWPGHSYYFAVSDVDSMSYNEASGNCGMFEFYGIDPAPAGYVPSVSGNVSQSGSGNSSRNQPAKSGYTVTYVGGSCLAKVPTDNKTYRGGETVTVLFEPVEYMQGQIFNGWDINNDGVADFGYYYNTFTMPDTDVELKAICYGQYQNNNQFGVTTGNVGQNNNNNYGIYDPNTNWWFTPDAYYEFYYGGVG